LQPKKEGGILGFALGKGVVKLGRETCAGGGKSLYQRHSLKNAKVSSTHQVIVRKGKSVNRRELKASGIGRRMKRGTDE